MDYLLGPTVGLPDTVVKESKDRIRAAIKNCGYQFPVDKVTVNLAPASQKKKVPPLTYLLPWVSWRLVAK
ncbi:MAG: Subunit ChlI of Mg-chelatase [Candidatus Methanoperedenaceae archaeon GB50]|nr:MAG: Subunit ChlI of Mg-chelatase [Candidatus Methanoperedenaceae archaeon GB50]